MKDKPIETGTANHGPSRVMLDFIVVESIADIIDVGMDLVR